MIERNLQIGNSIKSKRNGFGWSRATLSARAGVSESVITKLENGQPVKDENLGKVLLSLGMKNTLIEMRKEKEVSGYKALSLEELRTCIAACKDFIRDSPHEIKEEVISYKRAAEEEMLKRMRFLFAGEDLV